MTVVETNLFGGQAAGEAGCDAVLELRQWHRRMLDQRQHRSRQRRRKLQHHKSAVRHWTSEHKQ